MLNEERQILSEAIRRARIEASRLESQLNKAQRTRELAASDWIGSVEIDPESLPSDDSIAKLESDLAAARAYLAELQAADDEQVREQVAQADAARAAHAATVDEAERAVYQARLDADLAIAARLKAAEAGDLDTYITHADTSDLAQRRLAAAKAQLDNLRSREVA